MLNPNLLFFPAVRVLRITLNVALAAYFLWLIWSGGHGGYATASAFIVMTIFNVVVERAKRNVA